MVIIATGVSILGRNRPSQGFLFTSNGTKTRGSSSDKEDDDDAFSHDNAEDMETEGRSVQDDLLDLIVGKQSG